MYILDILVYVLYCILLNNLGNHSLCNPNDKESDSRWPNASIKITTKSIADPSDVKENDSSQYDLEDDGISIKYKIKSTAICTKIEFGNDLIWEENANNNLTNEEYPIKITLKPYLNNIWLDFPKKIHIYTYRSNKWELSLNSSCEPKPTVPEDPENAKKYIVDLTGLGFGTSKVKIIDINDKDSSDVEISSLDDFDLVMEGSYFVLYKYKIYNRCVELRYNDTIIWKDPTIKESRDFPNIIYISRGSKTYTFDFSGWYLWLYAGTPNLFSYLEWKWLQNSRALATGIEGSLDRLKITTIDKYNRETISVGKGDSNNNIFKTSGDPYGVFRYEFDDNARCVEIVYKNTLIWKYDERYDVDYPTEVYTNIFSGRTIKVKFIDRSYTYRFIYTLWHFVGLSISGELKYDNNPPLLIPTKETLDEKMKKLSENKKEGESEEGTPSTSEDSTVVEHTKDSDPSVTLVTTVEDTTPSTPGAKAEEPSTTVDDSTPSTTEDSKDTTPTAPSVVLAKPEDTTPSVTPAKAEEEEDEGVSSRNKDEDGIES